MEGAGITTQDAVPRLRERYELVASDEEMVALVARLASNPDSPGEHCDARWRDLQELDTLLSRIGPIPPIREKIKIKASAIRNEFLVNRPRTSDEALQYIRTLEILRDVGVESLGDVPKLRKYSWEIVQYYLRIHDNLRLSKALIAHAHNWRLDGNEYEARNLYTYPYQILKEHPEGQNLDYWLLRHNATLWYSRFFLTERHGRKQHDAMKEIEAIARDVNTPEVWLQTRCELAGYWASVKRDRDRALEECWALEQLVSKHDFAEYGMLAVTRAKIHPLVDSEIQSDQEKAVYLIRNDFRTLYLKHRHFYYVEPLRSWCSQLRFSLEFPPAICGSGILIYLPRN